MVSESLVMRRPRRTRTTFSHSQIAELEQHFQQGRYLTAPRLADLSAKLQLGTAQVKIWFKNRRRRHKIQSDKDNSYDDHNGSLKGGDADPPSLHALSLSCSGAAANPLTPSTTPSTSTALLAEQYSETFNAYYNYSNHNAQESGQQRQLYTSTTASNASSQFFQQQQDHEQQELPQQQPLQHTMEQQQQYQNFENGSRCRLSMLKSENDSEYSFNETYYTRTAGVGVSRRTVEADSDVYEPLTPKNDESPSLCGGSNGTVTDAGGAPAAGDDGIGEGVADSLAANEVDDADASDDMDDGSNKTTTTTTTTLQVSESWRQGVWQALLKVLFIFDHLIRYSISAQNLEPLKMKKGIADKSCDEESDVLDAGLRAVARGNNLIGCNNNGSSAFGKFSKLGASSTKAASTLAPPPTPTEEDMQESSQYQSTMDTIMQAYAGNTQFAYCFN